MEADQVVTWGKLKWYTKLENSFIGQECQEVLETGAGHVQVVLLVGNPVKRGMHPTESEGWVPLEVIAMDIVGPLPPGKSGNKYILVVSDYFTRWVGAFGIPSQDVVTVANQIVDSVFCRWRVPSQLHSDMGAQFESQNIQEISKILDINKTHTTPTTPSMMAWLSA